MVQEGTKNRKGINHLTSPDLFRFLFFTLIINMLYFFRHHNGSRQTKNMIFVGCILSGKKIGLEAQALLLLAKLVVS